MQLPPLDLKALLAPLDERQPAGTFNEEDELLQDIDLEMVNSVVSRSGPLIGASWTRRRGDIWVTSANTFASPGT